jgi:hypothetical protein
MPILTAPFSGVVWPSWLLPLRRRGKGGWKGEAVAVGNYGSPLYHFFLEVPSITPERARREVPFYFILHLTLEAWRMLIEMKAR